MSEQEKKQKQHLSRRFVCECERERQRERDGDEPMRRHHEARDIIRQFFVYVLQRRGHLHSRLHGEAQAVCLTVIMIRVLRGSRGIPGKKKEKNE